MALVFTVSCDARCPCRSNVTRCNRIATRYNTIAMGCNGIVTQHNAKVTRCNGIATRYNTIAMDCNDIVIADIRIVGRKSSSDRGRSALFAFWMRDAARSQELHKGIANGMVFRVRSILNQLFAQGDRFVDRQQSR